jgi:hypothetical protein
MADNVKCVVTKVGNFDTFCLQVGRVGVEVAQSAGRQTGLSSSPDMVKNFLFSTSSRPALGSTQPPIKRVPETLSAGVKGPAREADHLQLVPRSRKCGSIHPLPHTPSWRSA